MNKAMVIVVAFIGLLALTAAPGLAGDLEACFQQAAIDGQGPFGNLNLLKWVRSLAACTSGMDLEDEGYYQIARKKNVRLANEFMRKQKEEAGLIWKPWAPRKDGSVPMRLLSNEWPEDVDEMMEE